MPAKAMTAPLNAAMPGRSHGRGTQQGDGTEQRHDHDDESGDECGLGRRGAGQARGLEAVARGEAEAHQRAAGKDSFA